MAKNKLSISVHTPRPFSEARAFEVHADGVQVGYRDGSARFFERVRNEPSAQAERPAEAEQATNDKETS